MNLALLDKHAGNLSAAKASLQTTSPAIVVETYEIDVGELAPWSAVRGAVEQRFGRVDFLMLNAGVGGEGGWEDVEYFRKV